MHPLLPGTAVNVFSIYLPQRPFLEGQPVIRAAIPEFDGLYRVRFPGEQRDRYRLVFPGEWQTRPELMLEALTAQWRLTLLPELAADFWPEPLPRSRRAGR
jgi:hypothetical protein